MEKFNRLLSKRSMKASEWELVRPVRSLCVCVAFALFDIEWTLRGILRLAKLWPDSLIICSRWEMTGESKLPRGVFGDWFSSFN